ncbi:MAG TPA: GNAT family N-acetyltransferase [Bacteroidia bacterium]|nr:GNAT family N-acetyltransferase [Bacteroidia bacterium]
MIQKTDLNDIKILNVLVNSAYRGESSKQGWTTEADLLDGIRVDEERLAEIIQKPGSMILKYTDEKNKIIACVHLEKKESKLYLGMLTVSPVEQGRGIGKILMNAAEEEARKQNCSSVYMTVITDRTELIAWYERLGYVNTGEQKPFPAGDPRFGLPKKFLEFVVLEKKI